LVFSNTDKLIVVNGVENLMIIDSGEVLMVSSLDKEQEVKNIVADVKNKYKDYYS
jgi:mannose-1-phosphate guanylyltransferase